MDRIRTFDIAVLAFLSAVSLPAVAQQPDDPSSCVRYNLEAGNRNFKCSGVLFVGNEPPEALQELIGKARAESERVAKLPPLTVTERWAFKDRQGASVRLNDYEMRGKPSQLQLVFLDRHAVNRISVFVTRGQLEVLATQLKEVAKTAPSGAVRSVLFDPIIVDGSAVAVGAGEARDGSTHASLHARGRLGVHSVAVVLERGDVLLVADKLGSK